MWYLGLILQKLVVFSFLFVYPLIQYCIDFNFAYCVIFVVSIPWGLAKGNPLETATLSFSDALCSLSRASTFGSTKCPRVTWASLVRHLQSAFSRYSSSLEGTVLSDQYLGAEPVHCYCYIHHNPLHSGCALSSSISPCLGTERLASVILNIFTYLLKLRVHRNGFRSAHSSYPCENKTSRLEFPICLYSF